MDKQKLSLTKQLLITVLSLTAMVIGIGCMTGAVLNIPKEENYATAVVESDRSPVRSSPTAATEIDSSPEPITPEVILYPIYPEEGDNIGSLIIPVLEQKLPIIEGTGDDELKVGIGHFVQSVLPGEKDNCVLSGHRDTLFSRLGEIKTGDLLIVETSAGTFTYEVTGTRIVDKDDRTVIVPTENAVLTLSTCYPFNFVGNAPERYIVSADLKEQE